MHQNELFLHILYARMYGTFTFNTVIGLILPHSERTRILITSIILALHATNSYLVNELTSHRHLNLLFLWLGNRQQTTTQNRNNKKMNDIPCIVLFIFQFAKFHSCLF